MRLTGLATGMDTDATIKEMLKPQQTKIDNMKKDQEIVQWQQEIYRDIIKETNSLMSKYFDVLNKDNYLLGSSSLTTTKVTSSNPLLNMTASADAKEGAYKIEVKSLASNAKISGSEIKDINMGKTKLEDLGIAITDTQVMKMEVEIPDKDGKVESKTINIKIKSDMTIKELASEISKETNGEVKLEYSEISKSFEISTKSAGKNVTLGISSDSSDVKIIEKDKDGKEIEVTYKGISAVDVFEKMNIKSSGKVNGSNATGTITLPNGQSGGFDQSNNKFSLDGINFDINGMSKDDTVTITVSKSNDEAVKKIKSFVEDYNKLVDKVNKLNTEKRNYSYKPLTDAEKKDMTDDQIAKWEAKAKQGILKGDNYLNNMLSDLRTSMFGKSGDTLFSIGISTTTSYNDGGKLEFDEEKFLKKLNEDPEKTMDTFKNGMNRLDETLKNYTSTNNVRVNGKDAKRRGLLVEKAGYEGTTTVTNNILTKKIREKQELIDTQIKKMSTMETNYYKKFSNLETVMNKLNSQLGYLTQMMG
ncbi:flagellar filament capping protein FliD [Clostridium ihumii]|uniref:flagellar filament capping protein FliD n=1 Tax=Clostridium ihumii TaxID=1470356 RepID=UPI00058CC4B4|nr:flagellar filament capping protein FliD [Clostridium ihumii]